MNWLRNLCSSFRTALKWLVAGDEMAALERYREACDAVKEWRPLNERNLETVQWIKCHGEKMDSELGRALHIEIGRRVHSLPQY